MNRSRIENRRDPEKKLHKDRCKDRVEGELRARMGRSTAAPPYDHGENHEQVAPDTVNKLHQPRVFEEVLPKRLNREGLRRKDLPCHERPIRIRAPSVDPRDKRAKDDLHEPRMKQAGRKRKELGLLAATRLHEIALFAAKQEHIPRNEPKDHESKPKMCRQTIRGDRGHTLSRCHAGRDHPPPNGPLQATKCANKEKAAAPSCRDFAGKSEPGKANGPDQTDDAANLTMAPLPPIDIFEIFKFHPLVLDLPLIDLFVFVKFSLPRGIAHRWDRPGYGTPFGDREPAIGQPGQAADRDHHNNHGKKHHKPDTDRATGAAMALVDHADRFRGLFRTGFPDLFKNAAFLAHVACVLILSGQRLGLPLPAFKRWCRITRRVLSTAPSAA